MNVVFSNIYEEITRDNYLFDHDNVTIGDNLLKPWRIFKNLASKNNINVFTPDLISWDRVDVFVFLEMPKEDTPLFQYVVNNKKTAILMIMENGYIWKENFDISRYKHFRKVFTYNDAHVAQLGCIKLHLAVCIPSELDFSFGLREKLCTTIAGNKRLDHQDELYSKRVDIIKWFEREKLNDFDLFGVGWDMPYKQGEIAKLIRSISPKLLPRPFPSYKGKIERKSQVLRSYSFAICFENLKDLPGYITEKIFDSFFAGTVPIYWGANNILDYVPKECFIDYRDFSSIDALYNYIKNMESSVFIIYQRHIAAYLKSEAVQKFSAEYFSKQLLDGIKSCSVS